MVNRCGRKGCIEPCGDFFLAAGHPVGVDIEQHLRGAVAEPILGDGRPFATLGAFYLQDGDFRQRAGCADGALSWWRRFPAREAEIHSPKRLCSVKIK